jgi:hypothetical protein
MAGTARICNDAQDFIAKSWSLARFNAIARIGAVIIWSNWTSLPRKLGILKKQPA